MVFNIHVHACFTLSLSVTKKKEEEAKQTTVNGYQVVQTSKIKFEF